MNKKKLIEVLEVQSTSHNQKDMYNYILSQLDKIDCSYFDYNGCIYVTKGGNVENYPCIVSHMDTVHRIEKDLTAVEINGNITGFNRLTMSQTGIGGDDKVGVFIALQCLETFDNIKAVFFRDEETGCEGSYDPDMDFFKDCGFVLQCDRRGNKDFVTNASGTELSCDVFKKDIKKILKFHGYKTCHGMMTDVMALKESGIECSMANMSCGYYNPHCDNEYVNINDVANCLLLVKDLIISLQGNKYICKYVSRAKVYELDAFDYKSYYKKWADSGYDDYFDDWGGAYTRNNKKALPQPEPEDEYFCECCGEQAPLQLASEYNQYLCQKCIDNYCAPLRYKAK